MNYRWDSDLHLFRSERSGEFDYSDGVEVEQRLLDAVANAADRSTFSPELAQQVRDWPSEYHLSRRRHCLLRPLNIPPGSRVLELGCGCGAVTRYLGEIGAQVLAVEGSLMRARIAAQRSRELSNVRVVNDDLLRFQTDERFDYVLLIGVLEYAARFSASEQPFESYLQVVTRSLTPPGRVVVAIENQLGLKYLNGCTEDHVGARFFGVQDLYTGKTARTFGRVELTSLLAAAGLTNTSFFYPFPDYKLPSVVLSELALLDGDFNAADVVAHCTARDYNGSPYRSFDEALAIDVVHRNQLLADLSNSFLVVATTADHPAPQPAELAFSWSADRIPELCTQTTFVRRGSDIEVHKQALNSASAGNISLPGGITIRHEARGAKYVRGKQILASLKKARARSGETDAVVEALQPWVAYLLQHARTQARVPNRIGVSEMQNQLADYVIDGKFLDCLPSNLLDNGKELVPIDVEWDSDHEIPLGWVVTRGLIWSLMSGLPKASQFDVTNDVAPAICRANNLLLTPSDLQRWMELEAAFQAAVTGRQWKPEDLRYTSGGMISFNDALDQLSALQSSKLQAQEESGALQDALAEKQSRIDELNSVLASSRGELAQAVLARDSLRQEIVAMRPAASGKSASPQALDRWRRRRQLKRDEKLVRESGLFDADWYLARNPDVASSGHDPLRHYLQHGGLEGRDPGPGFDSQWYLDQSTDVRAGEMNPLVHYLRFGKQEGRVSRPVINNAEKV